MPLDKNMIPGKLSPGDTVGLIAPAGPVSEEETAPGISVLEGRGFIVRRGRHMYRKDGYLAGADRGRVEDLHEMFSDPAVKAVLCARGGYGSMRLLEDLDYDLIASHPKIFAGYSDITALLLSFYRRCRLVAFHGPMVRDCCCKGAGSMNLLLDVLQGKVSPAVSLSGPVVREGKVEGTLLGGNLTILCHLAATSFMPSLKGCILFLEDRGEKLYRIDRMLTQLALGGHLKGLAGLVAGDFTGCGDPEEVAALLGDVSEAIPVAAGLPVGHGVLNVTLPVGVGAELDTMGPTLRITGTWIEE